MPTETCKPALPPRPADLSVLAGYELGDILTGECRLPRTHDYLVTAEMNRNFILRATFDWYDSPRWIVSRNPRPTVEGWEFTEFRDPRKGDFYCLIPPTGAAWECYQDGWTSGPRWIAVRKPPAPVLPPFEERECDNCQYATVQPLEMPCKPCWGSAKYPNWTPRVVKPAPVPAVTLEQAVWELAHIVGNNPDTRTTAAIALLRFVRIHSDATGERYLAEHGKAVGK